ncbi:MAG: hypothetical protein ACAI34_25745 [Verrucomicrobium sp.]
MPVQSETSRVQYAGNGSKVTPYPVPFYFLANADVRVSLTTAAGVESMLAETSQYVLAGAGSPGGGSLRTQVAYGPGDRLTIYREPQEIQQVEFQGTGALPADSLTLGLDKLTMLVQSLGRKMRRTLRFTDVTEEVDALTAESRAGKLVGFSSMGAARLYDSTALLSLLSLQGSLQGAPTAIWTDAGGRAEKVPDFIGQLGLQLDTRKLYASDTMTAGAWVEARARATTADVDDLAIATDKLADGAVTFEKLQPLSTGKRIVGRAASDGGGAGELSLSELLDFVGSSAQGDLLYRGASTWSRLPAGTAGQVLRSGGAGAAPSWGNGKVVNVWRASVTSTFVTSVAIPVDNTIPQITEGVEVLTINITPSATSNFLLFFFSGYAAGSVANSVSVAVFRDAVASAVYAKAAPTIPSAGHRQSLDFHFSVPVPSTASQTWRVRAGPETAVTFYINQNTVGLLFDTTDQLTLTVMEVQP